jgi:hypothetical protein
MIADDLKIMVEGKVFDYFVSKVLGNDKKSTGLRWIKTRVITCFETGI